MQPIGVPRTAPNYFLHQLRLARAVDEIQHKSIAAKVRENRPAVEQKKFYVGPEHLVVGTEETLLRALTMAFAAAVEQGRSTHGRETDLPD